MAIDHYTKWVECATLKNKSAEKVAKSVEELIIMNHGTPEHILSDGGMEFASKHKESLVNKYNFEWNYNSPYHHTTTGCVERAN